MIHIMEDLDIPEGELAFTTSRSSGPGGQNVNKVNTRVTLLFDVAGSPSLSDEQRVLVAGAALGADQPGRRAAGGLAAPPHATGESRDRGPAVRPAPPRSPRRGPRAGTRWRCPEPLDQKRLEEKRRRGRLKRERTVDLSGED